MMPVNLLLADFPQKEEVELTGDEELAKPVGLIYSLSHREIEGEGLGGNGVNSVYMSLSDLFPWVPGS